MIASTTPSNKFSMVTTTLIRICLIYAAEERAVFTSSTCGHMRPEFQGNVLAVMVGEGNI